MIPLKNANFSEKIELNSIEFLTVMITIFVLFGLLLGCVDRLPAFFINWGCGRL